MGVTPIGDRHPGSSTGEERDSPRTWPWWLALAAGAVALAIGSGSGFDVSLPFVRLSAHNPRPPAVLAVVIVVSALLRRGRRTWTADLPALAGDVRRHAPMIAGAVAAGLFAAALGWNTWTIGGSDSHCYAAQARAFAAGSAHVAEPAALSAPWPDATHTFAPVGFLPSPSVPGELLPVCAPGYSLLLVPLVAIWPVLQFAVSPVAAAVAVWAAFRLARSLDDDPIAAVGAVLVVASAPIVLYQAIQPMTDVPAAAAIAAAAVFAWTQPRRPALAGLALGLGLLIRPNLLPVAVPFVVSMAGRSSRPSLARFLLALIPVAAIVLVMNAVVYGAPWRTGYGDTSALFSVAHIGTNLRHYITWMTETMTRLVALGMAAPWVVERSAGGDARVRISVLLLAVVTAVVVSYLAYVPFDEWWYLRFLLPAIPPLCALTAVVILALLRRAGRAHGLLALAVFAGLSWNGWNVARSRTVFDLWHLEQRLSATADYVGRLAPNAIAVAVQPNGAIRYQLGRPTLSWDAIQPDALDRVIDWAVARGDRPVIVIDGAEGDLFRARFDGASRYGALEWPPVAVINRTVRVYDPADRSRYLAGEHVATTRVDTERPRRSR